MKHQRIGAFGQFDRIAVANTQNNVLCGKKR